MFAVAPFSPASSPAIVPPSPLVFGITPLPLLEPAAAPLPFPSPPSPPSVSPVPTAPPVTLPATTSPPLPPTVPLPTDSPPPLNPPATEVPPVVSSPPPEIPLVPALPSPPITSNENPIPATPSPPITATPSPSSPATLTPPSVTFPSPAKPASPSPTLSSRHRKVAPALPAPTATSPPQAFWPLAPETTSSPPPPATVYPDTEPTLPSWTAAAPSSPTMPESSPEVTVPPPSGSLPVAVEVEKHSEFKMSSGLIVGIVIVGITFVFVIAVLSVLCSKKKKQKNLHTDQLEESSPSVGPKGSHIINVLSKLPHVTDGCDAFGSLNSGEVRPIPNHAAASIGFGTVNGIFTYDELVAATNGFSEANLLGEGGFGYVYKGVLPCGKEIAVKQLKTGSQQGEREFQAEVETISRVHHKHLVELVGYSVTRSERMLVYEFVPNNTLEFHLHGEGRPVMEWEKRIKIALGSAKGLAYLHQDCNPAIIHRDIKASNILLDFNFEAKVSDFGLAKIFPNSDGCITHLTTRVVGTFGYLAPEYASSGKLTDKSDVYSYGVMLLELITGRPPIIVTGSRNVSLVDWARPLLAQALEDGDFNNLIDPRLQKNYGADEMTRMITCAAACVRHSARLRPRMSQIAGALEGLVSPSDLVGDITPGHTTLYSWSDSSNYDACQYHQDLRNFNLALSPPKYSYSGHSESTSAYGLHLSDSSGEA